MVSSTIWDDGTFSFSSGKIKPPVGEHSFPFVDEGAVVVLVPDLVTVVPVSRRSPS